MVRGAIRKARRLETNIGRDSKYAPSLLTISPFAHLSRRSPLGVDWGRSGRRNRSKILSTSYTSLACTSSSCRERVARATNIPTFTPALSPHTRRTPSRPRRPSRSRRTATSALATWSNSPPETSAHLASQRSSVRRDMHAEFAMSSAVRKNPGWVKTSRSARQRDGGISSAAIWRPRNNRPASEEFRADSIAAQTPSGPSSASATNASQCSRLGKRAISGRALAALEA